MSRELLMQNSFAWTDAEGVLITADKALSCKAKNFKVEGKTFQNLSIISSGKTTMTSGATVDLFSSTNGANMIKLNTTYTLIIDIKDAYYTSDNFGLLTSIEYSDGTSTAYIALTKQTSGRYIRTFTFKNPVKYMNLGVHNSNTSDCYCDMSSIMLFEGDYTNSYIPSNVDGIKSVAEREAENGVYPLQITQSHNETDGIVLPNGVKNTIENGVHIQRVGKQLINETFKNWTISGWSDAMGDYIRFDLDLAYFKFRPKFNYSKINILCDTFTCVSREYLEDGKNRREESISVTQNTLGLNILRSKLKTEDANGLIEYLSKNPILLYHELETPITEPCVVTEVNMPIPLRSLPNGVCDTIEGNKIIQRLKKDILDGSESWYAGAWSNQTNTIGFELGVYTSNSTARKLFDGISNFPVDTRFLSFDNDSEMIQYYRHSTKTVYIRIRINIDKLETQDVDGFKKYLQSNRITFIHELVTPIEHTINIPPIPIAKGGNIVTTSNNIQPNLKLTYKKATRKKPTPKPPKPPTTTYLYNAGNEYSETTGGWNTQLTASYGTATTIVKNTDNIYFPAGAWNMLLTNNKIDVTNYDVVYMKYSKEYSPVNFHPARCAIKLGNKNTSWTDFADDETTGSLIGKDETENNVTNGILTIDVSNVTGSYYVGIGGQSNNITVHEIGLKKGNSDNSDTTTLYSNGNENTSLTGGYLTNSNSSATCNIEKQADNLYVNCTGKSSFDSICYARTNKTIKPCRLKVSVKNNYISANGIAFCVFLSEKEAINSVSDFNSVVNKRYIKASNTTQGQYIDLEIDLTDNTEGYFYVFCMVAGSADYTCKANISKIEII